jgi:hypothetical protein
MEMNHLFYRYTRAKDYLEIFLISAITTVLVNRAFLAATGYPQIGGGTLHIAHMLWGGLLMLVAITLLLSFIGSRIEKLSSLIGGIGFGLFIDELGKFITKDNNYFFKPTIGLIYAVFIGLYFVFAWISNNTKLSQREYELNALRRFEEVVINDLDPTERAQLIALLKNADATSPVVTELTKVLQHVKPVKQPAPNMLQQVMGYLDKTYIGFWKLPAARRLISFLLIMQALSFVVLVSIPLFRDFDTAVGISASTDAYANNLLIAEFISSLVASGFAVAGAIKLFTNRIQAYELFRTSILINLLLTNFFMFTRIEFAALPSFFINLAILGGLRYAIYEERRRTA